MVAVHRLAARALTYSYYSTTLCTQVHVAVDVEAPHNTPSRTPVAMSSSVRRIYARYVRGCRVGPLHVVAVLTTAAVVLVSAVPCAAHRQRHFFCT